MPIFEINLLPEKTYLEKKKFWEKQKLILEISLGLLVFFLFLVLIIFFFSRNLAKKALLLDQQIQQTETVIGGLRTKESLLLGLKTKVASAAKILSLRGDPQEILGEWEKILPQETALTTFAFSQEKKEQISLSVLAANASVLAKLNEALELQKNFQEIKIIILTREKTGAYRADIEAKFNQ